MKPLHVYFLSIGLALASLAILACDEPPIVDIRAVKDGDCYTLYWTSEYADHGEIAPDIGLINAHKGSIDVCPTETTTYTLTVSGPGGTASGSVTIDPPRLTFIAITPRAEEVVVGDHIQFVASSTDQFGNPISRSFVWSVTGGGTITDSGVFTSEQCDSEACTYLVRAEYDGVVGTASVTVIVPSLLTSMDVTPETTILEVGRTQCFSATGRDQFGNPISTTIDWSVNGGGRIDGAGWFTAISPGNFTITARNGSVMDTATVTVVNPPPVLAVIDVTPQSAVIHTLETLQYSAAGMDQYGDSISFHPTWSIDGGGTIDETGLFTPVSPGTFTIRVQDGDVSEEVTVIVVDPPEPEVNFDASPGTINDTTPCTLSWETSHASRVTIDNGIGEVTLNGSLDVYPAETTTYTITAENIAGRVTSSQTLNVMHPRPVVFMSVSPEEVDYGEPVTLDWEVAYVDTVFIDNAIGEVNKKGSLVLTPDYTTTYHLTATYGGKTVMAETAVKVLGHPPEPLPEASFGKPYEDLIPDDASLPSYDPNRFVVITGLVVDESGNPLEDVTIEIFKHSEYGTALTDNIGRFSIPADGGDTMTMVYRKPGFITSHRRLETTWCEILTVDDVTLVSKDPVKTNVVFDGNPDTIIRHRGTVTMDGENGNRSCTLVFTGDNTACETDKNGNVIRKISAISVRTTEFKTPRSMPADLPAASAFTYCVEMEADGVARVQFDKPVISYVENFLDFPVGGVVPAGYYDLDKGTWVASQNGVVVKLLDGDNDGIVDGLDATGDNIADDLNGDGCVSDEVAGLDDKNVYPPGSTYWRVEIGHFTPWDFNWPYIFPHDAIGPNPKTGPYSEEKKPCFTAGTLVHTKEGLMPIEEIRPGALVWARYEKDYAPVLRRITQTFETPGQEILKIYLKEDGEVIRATYDHPFWVVNFGWVSACKLVPGDEISTIHGRTIRVQDIEPAMERQVVYNLEVEGAHTYFVGWTGLWVHNTCRGEVEPRNRILNQKVAIPGTDLFLHYSSRNAKGYKNKIVVPVSGDTLPDSLLGINASVGVAGNGISKCLPVAPNQNIVFYWDGTNYRGQSILGAAKAKIDIRYFYPAVYAEPEEFKGAFGNFGGDVTVGRICHTSIVLARLTKDIIVYPSHPNQTLLGGWTISNHHTLSPYDRKTLYKGDGRRVENNMIARLIQTIAGNGHTSFTFDNEGGIAVQTPLLNPSCVTADGKGNCYFSCLHRILKVDKGGIITRVAGQDDAGYSGDGGLAVNAQLGSPEDIVFDHSGNMYITDHGYHVVRKIDANGIISTVAGTGERGNKGDGGPATEALMYSPMGLAVDNMGNLYISDAYSDVIRKVDRRGIISTVCRIRNPQGMDFDLSGNLYIASNQANRVYRLDTSGNLECFAGTGGQSYDGDGNLALSARLAKPMDVKVDSSGKVYIADTFNYCIRMVDTDGRIATVVGRSGKGESGLATDASLSYPKSIDIDSAGNLYIADTYHAKVKKVISPYVTTGYAGTGTILVPEKNGQLHIMSYTGQHEQTLDLATRQPL